MIIKTQRLLLQYFTEDDFDSFKLLMQNSAVMQFSINGPMQDPDEIKTIFQKRIINHYHEKGYGLLAVKNKETQKFMGFIGIISQVLNEENKVELGYRFLPEYWGQGFASEAGLIILNYAFTKFKFNEIISIIDPQNVRSINVARKLGLHFWKTTDFHHTLVNVYKIFSKDFDLRT